MERDVIRLRSVCRPPRIPAAGQCSRPASLCCWTPGTDQISVFSAHPANFGVHAAPTFDRQAQQHIRRIKVERIVRATGPRLSSFDNMAQQRQFHQSVLTSSRLASKDVLVRKLTSLTLVSGGSNLLEQFEMTLQTLEQFHHRQKGSAAHGEEDRRTVYWRPRF